MSKLALLGGQPVRSRPFPEYKAIGAEEQARVQTVMESGVLSGFLGTAGPGFLGGPEVRGMEEAFAEFVGTPYAVAMNSATSALYAALGAVGVSPGDEVIVPPYSMSASVTGALIWGAIPIFADIDEETFCLDPDSVREKLSDRTRAIVAVDLFGQAADYPALRRVIDGRPIAIIEDAAQAPGATLGNRRAGALGDIGIYSLNYHKHIHSGEGGVAFTGDERLARRLQLIRNHAEAVVGGLGETDLTNMIGFNFRMTELEAAIADEQLKKLPKLLESRGARAETLTRRLRKLPGFLAPAVRDAASHVYYVYAVRYRREAIGTTVDRNLVAKALEAEGVPVRAGYAKPLYLQPMFQKRIAIGPDGYPFNLADPQRARYQNGLCPTVERLQDNELLHFMLVHADVSDQDMHDVADAMEKVVEHIRDLEDLTLSAQA